MHHRDDVHILYKKERGRRLAMIELCVDASIQQLEDNIEKRGGRMIVAIRNNTNDKRTSGTEISRKQQWE